MEEVEEVKEDFMLFANEGFLEYNKQLEDLMEKISQARKKLEKLENEDLPALINKKDALPEEKKELQDEIDRLSEEILKHVGEKEKVQKKVEGYREKIFTEYPQVAELYAEEKDIYLDSVFAKQVNDFKAEMIKNNEEINKKYKPALGLAKMNKEKYESILKSKSEKQSLQFKVDMEKYDKLKYDVGRNPKLKADLLELINQEKKLRDDRIRFSRLTEEEKKLPENKALGDKLDKLEGKLNGKASAMRTELEEYGITREKIQQIFVDTDLKFSSEIEMDEAIYALEITRTADRKKEIDNFEKDNEKEFKAVERYKKRQEKLESEISNLEKQNEVLEVKIDFINENVREQSKPDFEEERDEDELEYGEDLDLDVAKENIFKRGWTRLKESRFGQAVKRFFSSGREEVEDEVEVEENKKTEPLDESVKEKIIQGEDFKQYIRDLANRDKEAINKAMEKEVKDRDEKEKEDEELER